MAGDGGREGRGYREETVAGKGELERSAFGGWMWMQRDEGLFEAGLTIQRLEGKVTGRDVREEV